MSFKKIDWDSVAEISFVTLFFCWPLLWWGGDAAYNKFHIACQNENVNFATHSINDPATYTGITTTTAKGVEGQDKVCKRGGKFYSRTEVSPPVAEVTSVGTKPYITSVYTPPVEDAEDQVCEVTLCNDGSCSYSQGRGTCSWHGGVAEYY